MASIKDGRPMRRLWEEICGATVAAIDDPKVGDRFHEMYSFWLYVVARSGESVITMDASPPCQFPRDGKLWKGTRAEFKRRLITTTGNPWVLLADRDNDVSGWLDALAAPNGNGNGQH